MSSPDSPLGAMNDDRDPREKAFWLRELREECERLDVKWTPRQREKCERQARWLAIYTRTSGRALATAAAGIARNAAQVWMREDPIFAPMVPYAREAYSDYLLSEMTRRGVEGVAVGIRDRHGNVVGEERKYSDAMLIHLSKGLDIEKRWAQKVDLSAVSEERWRSAAAALMRDKPELLEMLDRLADEMVSGGGTEG